MRVVDAFLEEELQLTIRRLQAHSRTVTGQFIHIGGDDLGWKRGIQLLQRRTQPGHQHRLALRLAQQRAGRAEGFLQRRLRGVA